MKTRELLTCNVKILGTKIQTLKAKELRRHIERIAHDLGETDTDALMSRVVDTLFGDEGPPESGTEEVRRVLHALDARIPVTEENADAVMRLVALCVAILRQGMRQAAREHRLAERRGTGRHDHHHHHNGHHCDDPNCGDHGHVHEAEAERQTGESPLAGAVRSTLG